MSKLERNKALVQRLYDETDKANIHIIDELFAEDVVNHQSGVTQEREGVSPATKLREVFQLFHTGFPDTFHILDDMIAEGDKVAVRVTAIGTHTGDMLGVKPTGKRVSMSGIVIYRIVDGKIVERWADEDRLGFYEQLGILQLPSTSNYR